jgi:hypothetical protein
MEAAVANGDFAESQQLGNTHLQLQDLIIQHGISNFHRPTVWRELMQLDLMIAQQKHAPYSVLHTDKEVCRPCTVPTFVESPALPILLRQAKDKDGNPILPLDESTNHQIEVDVRRTWCVRIQK